MKRNKLFLLFAIAMAACGQTEKAQVENAGDDTSMDSLRLALDWSPNVLHAPIFWAEMNGSFSEAGLHVDYFTPEVDDYTKKPIQRLLDREADLCIGPSEHLFFYSKDGARGKAVATILQEDRSCFVTRPEIESPKELSGKTYLGYKTPLEEEVLKGMIQNDGGEPVFDMKTPGRLDVWEAFLNGEGETAWVFSHWEAAMAEHRGVGLNKFYPNDYGVPYGYSSVIMAREEITPEEEEKFRVFLSVLNQSISELLNQPDSTVARKLCEHIDHPNFENPEFIEIAWSYIKSAFTGTGQGTWGEMSSQKWEDWLAWIREKDLSGKKPVEGEAAYFYTNALLRR